MAILQVESAPFVIALVVAGLEHISRREEHRVAVVGLHPQPGLEQPVTRRRIHPVTRSLDNASSTITRSPRGNSSTRSDTKSSSRIGEGQRRVSVVAADIDLHNILDRNTARPLDFAAFLVLPSEGFITSPGGRDGEHAGVERNLETQAHRRGMCQSTFRAFVAFLPLLGVHRVPHRYSPGHRAARVLDIGIRHHDSGLIRVGSHESERRSNSRRPETIGSTVTGARAPTASRGARRTLDLLFVTASRTE